MYITLLTSSECVVSKFQRAFVFWYNTRNGEEATGQNKDVEGSHRRLLKHMKWSWSFAEWGWQCYIKGLKWKCERIGQWALVLYQNSWITSTSRLSLAGLSTNKAFFKDVLNLFTQTTEDIKYFDVAWDNEIWHGSRQPSGHKITDFCNVLFRWIEEIQNETHK